MSAADRPRIAVFRPPDERLDAAVELLESLGTEAVPDPMLTVDPTGAAPRSDADYVVFTSKTGVELVAGERAEGGGPDERWEPGEATVCAIGESTADVLRAHGYRVDRVPSEFTSSGLVEELGDDVAGARVEVARSDHGSAVLLTGLEAAGAYVHETVLYRLERPADAGDSAVLAAEGRLDGAVFTSSLTVQHFLAAADERGVRPEALDGLDGAVVGVIGDPTAETATDAGIEVDVVPEVADFDALAEAVVAATADAE
ncbi:uroporphyrinogen-III synthase [Halosimplex carlsbadense 2-9-1]|uniref:Uroporphyrinogen-III synthase n=1 Tax=Halosimplex carlsbadense 2-9-1 TaxID=797114 RepID=M0D154_9EURY|nr:uroporphyrinogen-III synthase [Halosimplex carlsbadense]ELZ29241.1 uroporphyrinogen-III synthase [Halosimplex carlsbadense 2-9-1]